MQLKEAMDLLGFTSVKELTEEKIKSRWRLVMKKAHPDVGGDPELAVKCNEAYKVLLEALQRILLEPPKETETKVRIVTIKDLMSIYKERAERLKIGNVGEILSGRKIEEKLLVNIPIRVKLGDNEVLEENYVVPQTKNDVYVISVNVKDNGDIFEEKEIELTVAGRTIRDKMNSKKQFKFNFEFNITVLIQVERIISS